MSKRLFVIMFVRLVATTAAFGQGSAVKRTAEGNQPAGASAALVSGKVAIIDSRAFPEGIGEYKKQLDKLESEFQPRTKDLETIQNNLVKLDDELKTTGEK